MLSACEDKNTLYLMSKQPASHSSSEETPQPWYANGLKFTCTQCGNCCTGFPGYVWVNDAEIRAIAKVLGTDEGTVRVEYTRKQGRRTTLKEIENYDCVFFDRQTRGCKVYEARPRQCRTWPFWDSNLESPETWKETQQGCPGAGKGQFFSLEQIQEQAAKIHL